MTVAKPIKMPVISREFVYIPDVVAFRDGAEADPTTMPVDVAFVGTRVTPSDEWIEASWVVGAATPTARILVGPDEPGATALAAGTYAIWLRVRGAVEEPERRVGTLIVTA